MFSAEGREEEDQDYALEPLSTQSKLTLGVEDLLETSARDGQDQVEVGAAKVRVLDRVVRASDGQLEEVEDAIKNGEEESVENLEERGLRAGRKLAPNRGNRKRGASPCTWQRAVR